MMVEALTSRDPQPSAEIDLLSTSAAGPAAVKGGVLRVGSFIGGSVFSLGASALLFRHLGVVDTGRYTTAISLSAVITGLTDLGLTTIGVRELAVLRGDQRAALARNLLGMRLALTTIGVLIIGAFTYLAYGGLLGLGVLIASSGALIQNVQTTFSVSLIARLRLGWVSTLDLIRYLSTAATVALLVIVGAHLLAFLAVPAVAGIIVLPLTVLLVRGDIPLRPSFDSRQWHALVRPLLAYAAASVTAVLYLRVAIVLVSLLAGSQQLGYFSVSYRVVEALLAVPGLLIGSAFPIFARAAREDPVRLGYALSRVFDASLMMGVWISLSLAVGAPLFISLIAGPGFRPAGAVLAVQGIAVAAVFVGSVWSYGLLSLQLHRVTLIINLALLGTMTIVVAVAASLDGAMGAAIGTAAVEVASVITGGLVLIHGRPHLRPSLRLLPRVAIAALAGASPLLLAGVPTLGKLLLSSGIYFVGLLLLGALPRELSGMLPNLRPGV